MIDTGQLERAAVESTASGANLALFSIAMSLKRIADALNERNEYGEGPAAAIGAGIERALRGQ